MKIYDRRTPEGSAIAPAVLCSLVLAACASSPPPEAAPPPVPDTITIVDTVIVELESGANAELEQRLARLQLELLDRDAQLSELRGHVAAAHQEVVRTMAKLQTQATRAEASSGIAEAEIAVQDLGAAVGQDSPVVAEAQEFLDRSNAAFADNNFDGALYLATQARIIAEGAGLQLRGTAGQGMRPDETLFRVPVPLQTLSRSNVRDGPGLNFSVLFTLDPGTALVGRSHTDQWVRVTDDRGRPGWIFHSLVGNRQ
jgi:hypothetical protein